MRESRIALVALAIFAVAAHGLLLLNDGLYGDSLGFYFHTLARRWDLFWNWAIDTGLPLLAPFHILIGQLPNFVFGYKLVAFAALLISALCVYHIARRLSVNHADALLIAAISLIYPAYQTTAEHTTAAYLASLSLFLVACLISLRAIQHTGARRLISDLVALTLFAISFTTGSLLTFYACFVFVLFVESRTRLTNIRAMIACALRHWHYLALPIVYWVVTRMFFPPIGIYAGYNLPGASALLSWRAWAQFIDKAIVGQFVWSLDVLNAAGAILALLLLPIYQRVFDRTERNSITHYLKMLALGAVLLVMGILPYVAVDRLPVLHGMMTRLSLLVGIPIGAIFVALVRLVFVRNLRLGAVVTLIVLAAFVRAQIDQYIAWQAQWAKDRSVIVNLRASSAIQKYSIIEVNDQFSGLPGEWWTYYLQPFSLAWNGIFRAASDGTHWQANADAISTVSAPIYKGTNMFEKLYVPERARNPQQTYINELLLLDGADFAGCRAKLTILRNAPALTMGEFGIARRYWYYRFVQPAGMDDFLRSLTHIEITPVVSPQATRCSR